MPFSSRSNAAARLLLIDADTSRGHALANVFAPCFAERPAIIEVGNGRQAAEMLRRGAFDVMLIDLMSLGDLAASYEEAIVRLVKLAEGALAIVLSEAATVSAAVVVMRAGAHDFIARPIEAEALATRIGELAQRHGKNRLSGVDSPLWRSDSFGGDHAASSMPPPSDGGFGRRTVLPMWQQEQRIIEEAIASFAGNVALAAAALQLSPSTIYRKRQAWAEAEGKQGAA